MRRVLVCAALASLGASIAFAQPSLERYELVQWVVRGPALASLGPSRPAPTHVTVGTWARGGTGRLRFDVTFEGEPDAHRFVLGDRVTPLPAALARWSRVSSRFAIASAPRTDASPITVVVGHGGPTVRAAPPGEHELVFADRGMVHHVRIEGTAPHAWQLVEPRGSGSGQAFLERTWASVLRARGLHSAEARALVATWREHLVPADDEIRVVRLLEAAEIDALVRVRARPTPRRVVSVGLEIHVLPNAIPAPPSP